ncbi:MAG: hypothetical protein AAF639_39105, partial [Chloroflexota bacterium]
MTKYYQEEVIMLDLLHCTYQQQPERPLNLPTCAETQIALFDQIKQNIVHDISQSKASDAQNWTDLAWAIAYQTEDDEHIAQANWCSGIFYGNRDIRRSVKHFQETVDYFGRTQQSDNEGRVLIGYAGQINMLGQLDDAEQALNRAIECLSNRPDYQDWPSIYNNQAYIYIEQGRYHKAIDATKQVQSLAVAFTEKFPEKRHYYDMYRLQGLINRGLAAVLCYDADLANHSLTKAIQLAKQYRANEFSGRAHLNLARLNTLQGNLFDALRMLKQARQDFGIAQSKNEQALILQYEADIYRQLMMHRYTRETSIKAAQLFEQEGLVSDSVEAYLTAIEIALWQKRKKLARNYLNAAFPLLDRASPDRQQLWRIYDAHPLLRSEQQYTTALKTVEDAAIQLTTQGSIQYALTARLIGAKLVASLSQTGAIAQYQTIIDEAHRHGLVHLEQSACIELARLQPSEDAEYTLRRAADILVYNRQAMPVEELKANLLTGQMDIYVQLIETQLKNNRSHRASQTLLEAKGGIWT